MSDNVLVEVAMNYVSEVCEVMSRDDRRLLIDAFSKYVSSSISYEKAKAILVDVLNNPTPLDKLCEIMFVSDTPLPPVDEMDSESGSRRKKTRTWSSEEDHRLIMGVYKYGVDNWNSIALFVGHSRSRSQCSQRWIRVLDPHISKSPWSESENRQLLSLVKKYGTKMWVKIASEMDRRSDVQCRYRYKQLVGGKDDAASSPPQPKSHGPKEIQPPPVPVKQTESNTDQFSSSVPPHLQMLNLLPQQSRTIPSFNPSPQPPQQVELNQFQKIPIPTTISTMQSLPINPMPSQIPNVRAQLPTIQALQMPRFDQIPLARPQPTPSDQKGNINLDAPILLRSSTDFFCKSDQLFDSSFWTT